jgi:hypothetical protein
VNTLVNFATATRVLNDLSPASSQSSPNFAGIRIPTTSRTNELGLRQWKETGSESGSGADGPESGSSTNNGHVNQGLKILSLSTEAESDTDTEHHKGSPKMVIWDSLFVRGCIVIISK